MNPFRQSYHPPTPVGTPANASTGASDGTPGGASAGAPLIGSPPSVRDEDGTVHERGVGEALQHSSGPAPAPLIYVKLDGLSSEIPMDSPQLVFWGNAWHCRSPDRSPLWTGPLHRIQCHLNPGTALLSVPFQMQYPSV